MPEEVPQGVFAFGLYLGIIGQAVREICRGEHGDELQIGTVKERLRYLVAASERSARMSPDPIPEDELVALYHFQKILEEVLDAPDDRLIPLPRQPDDPSAN